MIDLFDKEFSHKGNKGENLNFLYLKGFNVAPGYVITNPEEVEEAPFSNSIVRSNGIGEDGKCSFSGIFKSVQNVKREEFKTAVNEVFASFSSPKYKAYSKIKKCEVIPGILVQKMIESKYSAVAHVFETEIFIDYVKGNCENIVSGTEIPKKVHFLSKTPVSNHREDIKFSELVETLKKIKTYYDKAIEVEMTFDGEKWWVLQVKGL